jgi:Transglycosylase SLT domain/SPOR domain
MPNNPQRGTLQSKKSAILAVIFSLCLWLAGAANAQLAEPEGATEDGSRPASRLPMLRSGEEEPRDNIAPTTTGSPSVCQLVASAAAANGLPFEFFARVIWQESRFRSDAVGPMTRSGQRAQGIAQFMPMTAEEHLLHDPFDPVEALPKSGEFLRDMRDQFGNLGLAAAAYNAGPQRVRDWLAGKRTLPLQTQTYVRIVTGRPAQQWIRPEQEALTVTIPPEMTCTEAAKLVAMPQSHPTVAQPKPLPAWVVQLIGDRSEAKALSLYRQLRKKHEALLGIYEPVIVRTTLRVGAAPIWTRVRIGADSRQAAETLCSRLRTAGEECLAQRN